METVRLETYTGSFEISREWLDKHIGDMPVDEFMSEYIWDDGERIYRIARAYPGVIINFEERMTADDHLAEAIKSWDDGLNDEQMEYVVNALRHYIPEFISDAK